MEQIESLIYKITATKNRRFWLFFGVLIILSLLVAYSVEPVSRGVDFHFHYRRFIALINALRDGNIVSYLDYNAVAGYGYMSNTFYPDFVLIPSALIGLITGPLFAYQFTLFATSILCGYFTYRTVNIIFRSALAGYVAGILYTFCNYRLFDYIHRSSLGELITFVFVPIVILGLYYIIHGNYKKWYVITIGFSLIIFSHAISSLLMFITLLVILLFNIKRLAKEPVRLAYLAIAGVATVLITSCYLFPMIEQMQSNEFYYAIPWQTADGNQLSLHWIISGMTTGPIYPNLFEPPKLGLLLTLIIALRLFVREKQEPLKIADRMVLAGFVLIIITSTLFPWSLSPFNKLNFIQFPWRLFEFVSFLFAVAGGYYLSQIRLSRKNVLIFSLAFTGYIAFLVVSDSKVYHDKKFEHLHSIEPNIENHYLGSGKEYLPLRIDSVQLLYERGDIVISENGGTAISEIKRDKGKLTFDISATQADKLELPLIYYLGYSASLNGKDIAVEQSDNGLIQIPVDQSGRVETYYKGTIVQWLSFGLTIVSIFAFCVYIYISKKKRKKILIALG